MPLKDLPVECLQGRLGEICDKRLTHFPRAYAWIALLAAGSAMIDQEFPDEDGRVNLYGCLVGEVHSGKSQAIKAAVRVLGLESPVLVSAYSGSAEAFARSIGDAHGNPRLWALDEIGFMLDKAQIEHASFPHVLCSAFNDNRFSMHMGKKQSTTFNCSLSILGGMVQHRFSDMWGKATTAGLYDRFMFGMCPSDFEFDYWPTNGVPEPRPPRRDLLKIDPEVWFWRRKFQRDNKTVNQRVVEIAIRAGLVCTFFDGERLLTLERMRPHIELIGYQQRMRLFLKPNPGENPEAQVAFAVLDYLDQNPGFQNKRDIIRKLNLYRKGPSNVERAFMQLSANNDIVEVKSGRQILVRKALESENEMDEIPPEK